MSVDDDVVKGGEGGGGGGESHRPSPAETAVQVVVVGAAAASPAVADDGAPAAEQTTKQQNQPQPSVRRQDEAAGDDGNAGKEAAVARVAVKSEAASDVVGAGKEAAVARVAAVKSEAAASDVGKEAAVARVAAVKSSEAARGETTRAAAESRTVRLLGAPLTSHGPYEFYGALAYRDDQEDAALKKKTRWKKRPSATAAGSVREEQEDEEDDDGWSVVRMNHFYAVRPWYSKRHGCAADRKQMRLQQQQQQQARRLDRSPESRAAAKERREHRHQQSVCIGELELLWRDDTVRPAAKRGVGAVAKIAASSDDEATRAAVAAGPPTEDPSAASAAAETADAVPRRRMLPRRTRQPSAKKIEAAESLAVAAAAAAADNHPMHQTHRRKLQQQQQQQQSAGGYARSAVPGAPWGDYAHGNLLCSVRLYVMPDQTAAGRLSGVHGDDEVLEINTWGANGGGGGADGGNAFVNGGGGTAYNGGGGGGATGDDYGGVGDSGASQSSCAATGCSGLVLRVEDFVEWVRGGLMNDDDDEEWSSASDGESRPEEAAVKREYDQKSSPKEERQEASVDVGGRRRSAVDEAVSAESVPLAAAKIVEKAAALRRGGSRVDSETAAAAVNGGCDRADETKAEDDRRQDVESRVTAMKTPTTAQKTRKMKTGDHHQQLVVMSYSRYCRYRAQLQRGQEERLYDSGGKESSSVADRTNAVRVLFCRDTYDYPAELLLQPFNSPQHGQQQNSPVLVNHMAPKLKGWPAHPASWMSFRWNRVRRRLRHMERGNASNDEQRRRRRRRKLKKKCRRRQNGNNATGVSLNYLSSSDEGDSDDTDTDGSSASKDGNTNTTTSDSDGAPSTLAVTAKATSKNLTSKENGSGHYIKKPLSGPTASNTFVINGTTVSTIAVNKRPAVVSGQSGQQQSTKRRRFVYPVAANQPVLQRGTYQQLVFHPRHQQPQKQLYQQFNQLTQLQRQHLIVAQQQHQQRQSLNKRLPVPVSSLQPSSTRLIHHHLPPSVSIVPVVVSGTKNVTILQQQQQRFNNKLQIRPKPHANVSITQRPNINSGRQQMSLAPVMVEYNKNRKHGTNDNSSHKSTTMAAAIAACQKRASCVNFEGEQLQQREDEERQRRWLVDALRLGGLEVTAVPLKGSPVSPNKSGSESSKVLRPVETSVQPKREKPHSNTEHPNGSVPVQNEQRPDCSYDDSNQDSDTDSVVMTVTPDVICLLNKSQQHQQLQLQTLPVSSSTPSMPALKQLRPSVTVETVSSSSQNAGTEPALHDKITRAIDALKKQQKQSLNSSNSSLAMDASSLLQDNSVSDSKLLEPRQRKLGLVGPPPRLIKTKEGYLLQSNVRLSGKPLNAYPSVAVASGIGPPRLLSAIKINTQQQQLLQQQLLQQQQKLKSPAKNFDISILPATTSTATNATQFQLQQQQKVCVSAETRSVPVESSKASFSMAVKQQLQRRIATGSSTVPALPSVADSRIMSVMGSEPTLQQLMQHQIIVMGTPAAHASQTKQIIIDKINLQPKKKD